MKSASRLLLGLIILSNWLIRWLLIWQNLAMVTLFIGLFFRMPVLPLDRDPMFYLLSGSLVVSLPVYRAIKSGRRLMRPLQLFCPLFFANLVGLVMISCILVYGGRLGTNETMVSYITYGTIISFIIKLLGQWIRNKVYCYFLYKHVIDDKYLSPISKSLDNDFFRDLAIDNTEYQKMVINERAVQKVYQTSVGVSCVKEEKQLVFHNKKDWGRRYYITFVFHPFNKLDLSIQFLVLDLVVPVPAVKN